MNELTIAGKKYISSKRAAELTGYAKDYVGQLCREGYVEATMVGRSWYALESSIMEHRFGKDSKEESEAKTVSDTKEVETPTAAEANFKITVETPVYTREEVSNIPVVIKSTVNTEYHISDTQDKKSSIEDMQSAWQEWFSKKQSTMIESPEVIDERYEELEQEESSIPQEEVIASHKATSLNQFDYEAPAVGHAFDVVSPTKDSTAQNKDESVEDIIPIHKVLEPLEEEDFATFTSYPVKKSTRHGNSSSIVLRAVLLSAAIVALAVAAIGSGLAEKYITSSVLQGNSIVKFLEGKSELDK